MAKNKDSKTSNRTGVLDFEEFTVTHLDKKNGGEDTYDLREMFRQFDGRQVSITVTYDDEAPVVEEV
ncbi:YonK family protein [Niallia taxi]|uniref:YonK family protein n=1 Tax=Niallia taxi TaxID=2499688 RepID=UPI00300A4EF7